MTQRRNHRTGFTLTELLVVIAIIVILAALGTWGVFAMIGSQQRRNTENTIRVINKMLQTRWSAVIAEAKKEPPSPAALALAGNDPERARVIWIKARLVEAFPMRYAEVQPSPVGGPLTVVDTYIPPNRRKGHFNKYQQVIGTKPSAAGESAACLLLALQTLQSSDTSIDDQLKHAVRDSDGDGLLEFVDGWSPGVPLTFERFHLQAPNPAAAGSRNAKFADPTDSEGRLITPSWYNMTPPAPALPPRTIFQGHFHNISSDSGVTALYVIPAVGAPGKDRSMGTADDILSYQLRGE